MKVLIIDTSKKEALVALLIDNEEYIIKMPETMKHSESLINYIEKAVTDKNIELSDLDAFASIVGPGSFTGIRVGMAVVKAMSFALNKNIIASNMFEVVAKTVKTGYFILNSTMTTIYYGKIKNAKLIDAGYIKKDQFATMVGEDKVFALKQEQMSVESAYKDIEYIDNIDALIIENVKHKFEKQAFTLDKDFTPMYVQLSQAEENLKVKRDDK